MPERTDEMERRETRIVYAVFARGRLGLDHDLLAVYSTRERAQGLIDAQDERLRACLVICELELDRHPTDPYWSPPSMASAFHLLADMPDDFFPDGSIEVRVGAIRNRGDAMQLEERIAELERGRDATLGWLRETVSTRSATDAIAAIRKRLGLPADGGASGAAD
jgi:hypothetical protein